MILDSGENHGADPMGADKWTWLQEMMNFWKQTTHVMSYFKDENFRGDKRLPSSFMAGFLEVSRRDALQRDKIKEDELTLEFRVATENNNASFCTYIA